ncbi:MAG: glycoside hydrolase family 43 protein [Mangrovibacterium sp.]
MNNRVIAMILMVSSLCSCSSATKKDKLPQGVAYFQYVEYLGNDKFYVENPLTENQYYNPVLQGCYSDPSVCQKGTYFYLVSSTFSFFPAMPIFRSTDMVNWEQIGNVLDREEQFQNFDKRVSQGIYAPALTYNEFDDTFYLVTTFVGGGGNFMVKAKDPAGPWSNPIWLPEVQGIDPSIFIDHDGTAYICNNQDPEGGSLYQGHKAIWLQKIDLETGKTEGERQMIRNGGNKLVEKPVWIEGPHVYHIGSYYYLLASEGGTSSDHAVCFYRGNEVWGPYEACPHNPVLTQRKLNPKRKNPVSNAGHADIVQMSDGSWRAVFLACRPYTENNDFNLGRETFMLPFEWRENWPYFMGSADEIQLIGEGTALKSETKNGNFKWIETFEEKKFPLSWMFLRTPQTQWWSFPEERSGVMLTAQPTNLREQKLSAFIGTRQQHHDFTFETKVQFDPCSASDFAGITLFQNKAFHITFGMTQCEGKPCAVVCQAEERGDVKRGVYDAEINAEITKQGLAKVELKASTDAVVLRVVCERTQFSFYVNDELLLSGVDAKYLSVEQAGGFVGTMLALYVSSAE